MDDLSVRSINEASPLSKTPRVAAERLTFAAVFQPAFYVTRPPITLDSNKSIAMASKVLQEVTREGATNDAGGHREELGRRAMRAETELTPRGW